MSGQFGGRDELTRRRLARLLEGGTPVVQCDGEGCVRMDNLVVSGLRSGEYDAPAGWWISSPKGHLEVLCPICRLVRGV